MQHVNSCIDFIELCYYNKRHDSYISDGSRQWFTITVCWCFVI